MLLPDEALFCLPPATAPQYAQTSQKMEQLQFELTQSPVMVAAAEGRGSSEAGAGGGTGAGGQEGAGRRPSAGVLNSTGPGRPESAARIPSAPGKGDEGAQEQAAEQQGESRRRAFLQGLAKRAGGRKAGRATPSRGSLFSKKRSDGD